MGAIPSDEASAVQNYVEHMLFLLIEEESGQNGAMGPILEFVVMENVMERLFVWSLRREFTDDMKLDQLKMYEMLIAQARQPLLHHKPTKMWHSGFGSKVQNLKKPAFHWKGIVQHLDSE